MNEETIAAILGMDVATHREIKQRFDTTARDAALELLADPAFAARVDRLPFRPNEPVIALGDSFTDDLQSWFEILRHLVAERRPVDAIRCINAGISAQTTAMALRQFAPLLAQHPGWILCCLGGNDAVRIGRTPTKTLVSLAESAANLEAMRHLAASLTSAQWAWITPPPLIEARIDAFPPFQQGQSSWRNADISAIADVMRRFPEPVIDLAESFGLPADPALQGPDGCIPRSPVSKSSPGPSSSA
jgi:acyl-CoA thioesterase I